MKATTPAASRTNPVAGTTTSSVRVKSPSPPSAHAAIASAWHLDRGTHPGRDDVKYFAIPWKCFDDSCDKFVESHRLEATWAGYPQIKQSDNQTRGSRD